MSNNKQPVCLTIAGLDPSGGAGIIADIKTFSAFDCFAAAAITSVTFQNTTGVFGAVHQSADSVKRQIDAVLDDFDVSGIKTGMLPTSEIIETAAEIISRRPHGHLVVDPVVRSTSGYDLIDDAALRSLITMLFPFADVVTPNIPEAERIAGIQIRSAEDISKAAEIMFSMGAKAVLIKGGHRLENRGLAVDHLFTPAGVERFESEYIDTTATHGTGCTLAAAITANLAKGKTLSQATEIAKRFVNEAIRTAPELGHGHSPINIVTWRE